MQTNAILDAVSRVTMAITHVDVGRIAFWACLRDREFGDAWKRETLAAATDQHSVLATRDSKGR